MRRGRRAEPRKLREWDLLKVRAMECPDAPACARGCVCAQVEVFMSPSAHRLRGWRRRPRLPNKAGISEPPDGKSTPIRPVAGKDRP